MSNEEKDPRKPDGYIPSHLLIPCKKGRVLSDTSGKTIQYGAACDPENVTLPKRNGRTTHVLTGEPRAVSCEKCRQTPEFAAIYEEVVGESYDKEKCPILNPQPVEIGGMELAKDIN